MVYTCVNSALRCSVEDLIIQSGICFFVPFVLFLISSPSLFTVLGLPSVCTYNYFADT